MQPVLLIFVLQWTDIVGILLSPMAGGVSVCSMREKGDRKHHPSFIPFFLFSILHLLLFFSIVIFHFLWKKKKIAVPLILFIYLVYGNINLGLVSSSKRKSLIGVTQDTQYSLLIMFPYCKVKDYDKIFCNLKLALWALNVDF